MKKNALITVALASLTNLVFAQDESYLASSENKLNKLRIGVFAAPTLSSMRPLPPKMATKPKKMEAIKLGLPMA